ncbi:hypothetical protein SAMN05518801_105235 [Novosphingobium sp. CF614]|uniref:hypothetical protein n=1 Tax=Novosphingobium sp. CF614 TaxID=1884364 RepID=UPI0008EFFFB5|nr:hypothetical protein [Novosphingobium sp. CF614]SFG02075.1 hypothetical protein SAMN05518801_105235 [Novosphingobium sp. CF614]
MSIQLLTPPFANDGRLDVLLFDDLDDGAITLPPNELEPMLEESKSYSSWMAITVISDLDDMRALTLNRQSTCEESGRGGPFDVSILDYKLCGNKERCSDPRHAVNGMHHKAAGLTAGVLAANKWPSHVQAIIPWSAYTGEAAEFWALCSSVQADYLFITDPNVTSKSKHSLSSLLAKHVAPSFREALARGMVDGTVAIPAGERETLNSILAQAGEWIDANTQIKLNTVDGLRYFKLGALFFDQKRRIAGRPQVPVRAVRDLVDSEQRSDPIFQRARQLASLFWNLRCSQLSHESYTAIRHGKAPPHDVTFPWIGASVWRPAQGLSKVDGARSVRLAILFLLLFEYRLRIDARELSATMVDGKDFRMLKMLDSVFHTNELDALVKVAETIPEIADRLPAISVLNDAFQAKGFGSAFDILTLQLPLNSTDIVQLLDPIPAPRKGAKGLDRYSKTLAAGSKIGAAFGRLFDGKVVGAPGRSLDLDALLFKDAAGAREMLLPDEWRDMTLLAVELMKVEHWPTWLSDNGTS